MGDSSTKHENAYIRFLLHRNLTKGIEKNTLCKRFHSPKSFSSIIHKRSEPWLDSRGY